MTLNVFRFTGLNSALALKAPARCATTVNITLQGLQTIDGVALQSTDTNLRVLVMNQTDSRQNGLYDAQSGPWTRCADMDSNDDVVYDTRVNVQYGAVNQGQWALTAADPITIGTSNMTFSPALIFEIAWGSLPVMSDPDPVNDFLPIIDTDSPTVLERVAPATLFRNLPNGTAAAPALAFNSDQGTGLYRVGAGQLGVSLAGSLAAFFTAAVLQLGAADAAAPVAQTLRMQSVASGNSNVTGADFTLALSLSTGQNDGGRFGISATPGGASGTSVNSAVTAFLTTEAANILALTNAANANTFRVYNTRDAVGTKLTNYERFVIDWTTTTNLVTIGTQAGGTGTKRDVAIVGGNIWSQGFYFTDTGLPTANGGFLGSQVLGGFQQAISVSRTRQVYFAGGTGTFPIAPDTYLGSVAAATWQFGQQDAAAPVAQTLQVQSVVTGTSNTAGADWTLRGSLGTGSAKGGDIVVALSAAGSSGSTPNAASELFRFKTNGNLSFGGTSGPTIGTTVPASTQGIVFPGNGQTYVQTNNNTVFLFDAFSGGALTVGVAGFGGARSTLSITSNNTFQLGAADAAAPIAQTLQVQNVVAGTSNTNGVNWTIIGSLSTGSGTSGDIIFQTGGTGAGATSQNTATTALTIKGATQQVIFATNVRINVAPTANTSAGPSTITSSADSATNLGHRISFNLNGTTYWIPCGSVAF